MFPCPSDSQPQTEIVTRWFEIGHEQAVPRTREYVRACVLKDGYNPAHVDAYLAAHEREDSGFVVVGQRSIGVRRFFEARS